MRRPIIGGLAVLLLAATPSFAEDPPETWNLNVESDGASLGYMIADSDDAGPMLTCDRPARGLLRVLFWIETGPPVHERGETLVDARGRPGPWPATLRLQSGRITANFPGTVESEEMYGGFFVTARVPMTAPVVTEFSRTGRIVFSSFGQRETPPAAPRTKITRLLAACRR